MGLHGWLLLRMSWGNSAFYPVRGPLKKAVAVFGVFQVHEAEVMWCEKKQGPTLCYGGEREKEAGKAW